MRTRTRVLVTGSRTWVNGTQIGNVLAQLHPVDALGFDLPGPKPVLVSGACPQGADRAAEIAAGFLGWTVERHPADWDAHGKRAGFIRNAEMVDLGADLCLAFVDRCAKVGCRAPRPHGSHGAVMCATLAMSAGIETWWHRPE